MATLSELLDPNQKHETNTVGGGAKLRIGIIGTGGIAHEHMRSYLNCLDAEVVCGADIVPGKAQAFFDEFGVKGIQATRKCSPRKSSTPSASAPIIVNTHRASLTR